MTTDRGGDHSKDQEVDRDRVLRGDELHPRQWLDGQQTRKGTRAGRVSDVTLSTFVETVWLPSLDSPSAGKKRRGLAPGTVTKYRFNAEHYIA